MRGGNPGDRRSKGLPFDMDSALRGLNSYWHAQPPAIHLPYQLRAHLSSGIFPAIIPAHTAAKPNPVPSCTGSLLNPTRVSRTTCSLKDQSLCRLRFLKRHRVKNHSCLQRKVLWASGLHQETLSK